MNKSQFKLMLSGCLMSAVMLASCGGGTSNNQANAAAGKDTCNKEQCKKEFCNGIKAADFDATIDGKKTGLYTLKNAKGTQVQITNLGGRIVSIVLNDKNGNPQDVVLGFDKVTTYADSVNHPSDFGASIGRYANRINKGKIVCDKKTIQLPLNNFGHCLHGGPNGWQYKVYDVVSSSDKELVLLMDSPDGDMNFPGNVKATVKFTLDDNNVITIDYSATTDKQTVINMTNHSYFNLNGDPTKPINNHLIYVNADNYTPVDATYMPVGKIESVKGLAFDCTSEAEIGERITNNDAAHQQIKFGNGFDHNWCLNTYKAGDEAASLSQVAASIYSPETGIKLEVYTNEPGIQVYSGNFLDGKAIGKKGIAYNQHAGICLETQKYPNSPNVKAWPSPYLNPGETYHSVCKFAFSVK